MSVQQCQQVTQERQVETVWLSGMLSCYALVLLASSVSGLIVEASILKPKKIDQIQMFLCAAKLEANLVQQYGQIMPIYKIHDMY